MCARRSFTWLLIFSFAFSLIQVGLPAIPAQAASFKGIAKDLELVKPAYWWSTVQAEIIQSEYDASLQSGIYQAPNRAQALRTLFRPQNIQIGPRSLSVAELSTIEPCAGETPATAWSISLGLTRFGSFGAPQPVGTATLALDGNRVEYRRAGLTEWYVNSPDGLEQGFTVTNPPAGTEQTGKLLLEITAQGNLTPVLAEDGTALYFSLPNGQPLLRYGALQAHDAAGQILPALLELPSQPAGSCPAAHTFQIIVSVSSSISYPITIDPMLTGLPGSPSWQSLGEASGARHGFSVSTAGDVNGDGYEDVLVGAPYLDAGGTDNGRAYLYYGSASGLAGGAAWSITGASGSTLGYSVGPAGDVNGDGLADILIGAPLHTLGVGQEGLAWIYYGSKSGPASGQQLTFPGTPAYARFGFAVAGAGDINGDGYTDAIIGAPYYTYAGFTNIGAALIYNGSPGGLGYYQQLLPPTPQNNAHFGYDVDTVGDVNGDSFADVIVGTPDYDNGNSNEGAAFVHYGSSSGVYPNPNWSAESNQDAAYLGISVGGAADVNGDGFCDVIIGAYNYNSHGAALAWYGGSGGLGASGTPANADWLVESAESSSRLGLSVGTAGDVNGDGYADVIVGEPLYGTGDSGRALVYQGGGGGLSSSASWTAQGTQANSWLGFSVARAGDVNGDGFSDILVGTPYFDTYAADFGLAQAYYGSASSLGSVAWNSDGGQSDSQFARAVNTAGDLNGDGYSDVVLGAYFYDGGETNEGKVFVYYGSAAGLGASADWSAEGNLVDASFGYSVGSAGDVNGDGYADLIIGAATYANALTNQGCAYVYHGSASGLPGAANWSVEGDQAGAELGYSVATAGDVNGDGYDDVIVGAAKYTHGEIEEGRAYVYHGSPTGLSTTPAWQAECDEAGAGFGVSVNTAGDVNGDSYADVIVGAVWADGALGDEGEAYVYHGSAHGLNAAHDWYTSGGSGGVYLGISVGTAGDVNGDGYDDVIIGVPYYALPDWGKGRAVVHYGSASGLSAAPDWSAIPDRGDARFGGAVGTAGDVNGDGYADVIVGAYAYTVDYTHEGGAFLYHGSASGPAASPNWSQRSGQAEALYGVAVATAGDVNGDGYSDVLVGAHLYDTATTNGGRAYLYYGNSVDGLEVKHSQRRADCSVPILPGGQSISPTQVCLGLLARTPFGRNDVSMQWELELKGVPFDGVNIGQTEWQDSGVAGYTFNQLISSLSIDARYHWRVRILARTPYDTDTSAIIYRSRWFYGSHFSTALSGVHTIPGPGISYLLGQASYVVVNELGDPPLTSLTLHGYPYTAHPQENFNGGGEVMLDRYYSLTPNSGTGATTPFRLTLCLAYDDAEVTAAGITNEEQIRLCRWTGSAWICPPRSPASNAGANLVCADQVQAFSEWTMGGVGPTMVQIENLRARSPLDRTWVVPMGLLLALGGLVVWAGRRRR